MAAGRHFEISTFNQKIS